MARPTGPRPGARPRPERATLEGPSETRSLSAAARAELHALGLDGSSSGARVEGIAPVAARPAVDKRPIRAPDVLNETFDYARPSSFSRGIRVGLPGATLLFLSGTASSRGTLVEKAGTRRARRDPRHPGRRQAPGRLPSAGHRPGPA